jgi:predicted benzoate:H+ symporter BenE
VTTVDIDTALVAAMLVVFFLFQCVKTSRCSVNVVVVVVVLLVVMVILFWYWCRVINTIIQFYFHLFQSNIVKL